MFLVPKVKKCKKKTYLTHQELFNFFAMNQNVSCETLQLNNNCKCLTCPNTLTNSLPSDQFRQIYYKASSTQPDLFELMSFYELYSFFFSLV